MLKAAVCMGFRAKFPTEANRDLSVVNRESIECNREQNSRTQFPKVTEKCGANAEMLFGSIESFQPISPKVASVAGPAHLSLGGIGRLDQCGVRAKLETVRPGGTLPPPESRE
jgi:hypothetical protein